MNKALFSLMARILLSIILLISTSFAKDKPDIIMFPSFSLSISFPDFINKNNCDQVIVKKLKNKELFKICYDYHFKGAKAVGYLLDEKLVNKGNVKVRPRFYSERTIPVRYRSKYQDYTHSGYDRGHLAPDADFDWTLKSASKTYTMANIIPQSPMVNRKTWSKAERYERKLATKYGFINVLNLVFYNKNPKRIGKNQIAVPKGFAKVLWNNKIGFARCFYYKNDPNANWKKDKLRHHIVQCKEILKEWR